MNIDVLLNSINNTIVALRVGGIRQYKDSLNDLMLSINNKSESYLLVAIERDIWDELWDTLSDSIKNRIEFSILNLENNEYQVSDKTKGLIISSIKNNIDGTSCVITDD